MVVPGNGGCLDLEGIDIYDIILYPYLSLKSSLINCSVYSMKGSRSAILVAAFSRNGEVNRE